MLREKIARIVDPNSWSYFDNGQENPVWADAARQSSLTRADEIIAIIAADQPMTDAELIYNAILRAERRLEEAAKAPGLFPAERHAASRQLRSVEILREEIGQGISDAHPA